MDDHSGGFPSSLVTIWQAKDRFFATASAAETAFSLVLSGREAVIYIRGRNGTVVSKWTLGEEGRTARGSQDKA